MNWRPEERAPLDLVDLENRRAGARPADREDDQRGHPSPQRDGGAFASDEPTQTAPVRRARRTSVGVKRHRVRRSYDPNPHARRADWGGKVARADKIHAVDELPPALFIVESPDLPAVVGTRVHEIPCVKRRVCEPDTNAVIRAVRSLGAAHPSNYLQHGRIGGRGRGAVQTRKRIAGAERQRGYP